MAASTRLELAQSMHPKIHISVPPSYLSALSAAECSPAVLLRLPPALFIDSNTFPSNAHQGSSSSAQVVSLRHLGSDLRSLSSYDFTRVELEGGVGYSDPSGKERARAIDWEKRQQASPSGSGVKRVGSSDRYFAASGGSIGGRYQDEHADAQRLLAKERRAVLLTFRKRSSDAGSSSSNTGDEEYDSLTGVSISKNKSTISIDIPIHSRYVEPVKGKASWMMSNYEEVQLDKPEVFWMCQGVEHSLDSSLYDPIDASYLLPSPHSHLSLQLPSQNHFYRLKMDRQETSLKLRLPAGDVSLAHHVHVVTFASLLLAAVWVVLRVQSVLVKLHKVQSESRKIAQGKAD